MKSFKQFIKPLLIPVPPVHGAHSKSVAPILIPVAPVHGAHSGKKKKKKLKEEAESKEYNHPETIKTQHWDHDHSLNHHLGRDEYDITHKLHKDDPDYHKRPGRLHIHHYTCDSGSLNHHLVKTAEGKPSPYDKNEAMHERIKNLDHAMKGEKMKHDLHVYHGANFNPDELASKHPERKIKSAAYLSTSHDKHLARMFSMHDDVGKRHILHVHLKKGDPGVFIGKHSEHDHENETLIPRNTTLKIHHKPDILHDGTKVWHAHVVDHHDD